MKAKILSNKKIAQDIYKLSLYTKEVASKVKPGQFVNIYLPSKELLLPRPFSILNAYSLKEKQNNKNDVIEIVFKNVGKGTDLLKNLKTGEELRILGPNGNGFKFENKDKEYFVVGGGLGIPPLLFLCKTIKENVKDSKVTAVLGFNDEEFLLSMFKKYTDKTFLILEKDKANKKSGNVINLLEDLKKENKISLGNKKVFSVGPKAMLRSMYLHSKENNYDLFVSLEERMGCGYGACVGCSIYVNPEGKNPKRVKKKVCTDGPVFKANEIDWEQDIWTSNF